MTVPPLIPPSPSDPRGAIVNPPLPSTPNVQQVEAFAQAMHEAKPGNIHGAFEGLPSLAFDPTLRGSSGNKLNVESAPSLGDAILRGIQQNSDSYQAERQALAANIQSLSAGDGSVDPTKALKLQADLIQYNYHLELSSKVANKLSQGIQTLFKNQ